MIAHERDHLDALAALEEFFQCDHASNHAAAVRTAVDIVAKMENARRATLERNAVQDGVMQGGELGGFAMHIADCKIDGPGHAAVLRLFPWNRRGLVSGQ